MTLAPRLEELAYPTGIAVADDGTVFVTESGLTATGKPGAGRVLRVLGDGFEVVCGGLRAPVTGLTWHDGALYVSEGGDPGRISRVDPVSGSRVMVLDDLPSRGDYHTNAPEIVDGWLYFGQGAATNAGVVSWDPVSMPWVDGSDLAHDRPGVAVTLADEGDGRSRAFQPFGKSVPAGTVVPAALPCTSAVMRCRLDGSGLELVAWGFRNPFSITRHGYGRLLVVDLGMNDRGARPFGGVQSCLYALEPGRWYGWPDYAGGVALSDPRLGSRRPDAPEPRFLLENHAELGLPAKPLVQFPEHSGPTGAVPDPRDPDRMIVALFGDKRPLTGAPGPKAGRKVVSVDTARGTMDGLVLPAMQRPIDVAVGPEGDLWVLDFGDYEIDRTGRMLSSGPSGALWRLPLAATRNFERHVEAAE